MWRVEVLYSKVKKPRTQVTESKSDNGNFKFQPRIVHRALLNEEFQPTWQNLLKQDNLVVKLAALCSQDHLASIMFVYKISFFVSFPGLVAQSCLTLQPHELKPARLLCPWVFPGKNAGVSCHFLLQGIFLTQGPKLPLMFHRWILDQLNYQGRPWYISSYKTDIF